MRSHSFTFVFLSAVTTVIASSFHDFGAIYHHARHLDHARRSAAYETVQLSSRSSSSMHVARRTSSSARDLSSSVASSSGLLSVVSTCGPIGASLNINSTSGPNGNIYWLNCGISDESGWNPTRVTIEELIVKDLTTALQDPNSPFIACSEYTDLFYQYGEQFNVPPIMIASFAMQESSCNASTIGGGGEQGLMQLTEDKCGDAPNGNCLDVNYNIMTGTSYFKGLLDSYDGDVFLSIGSYNGWFKGMTYDDATAAASSDCCRCQNNLDYVHQYVNGWCQNIDPYAEGLGVYHNLDVCSYDE